MGRTLRYALVTPARNEAENLERLAASLAAQSLQPAEWIVVDDGSEDGTFELAGRLPNARAIRSPYADDDELTRGRRAGRDVIAFKAGVAALAAEPDLVVKLDADVSLDPDFFERLVAEFEADPTLGIAGGVCHERDAQGRWRPYHVTRDHVRGATRTWRWPCFQLVSPLEDRMAWDVVDELTARLNGWTTRSIAGLPFYHHRTLGERDGGRRQWVLQGELAWFLGYRFSYMVLRALFRLRHEPAALVSIPAYVAAARRHDARARPELRRALRREQSLRRLPLRARQALGR
jgi:glycosyltransferase involved in cell wall biosynthesis